MLAGLHDPQDAAVWEAFVPIPTGARRIRPESRADAGRGRGVARETLARFVEQYREGRYERERADSGSWLVGIAAIGC